MLCCHRAPAFRAGLVVGSLCFALRLHAQASDTVSFVTTQGKDTVAIEQHVRIGNTITGAWIQHSGGVFVHDYALVLGNDGWPSQYVMTLYTARPHTFLLSVTYGADSATRIVVRDAVATTERVPIQHAYPYGALSILGVELALARAKRGHPDSTAILIEWPERRGLSQPLPVRFFGADSVRIGTDMEGRVDRSGRLLSLRDGPRDTRRVPSLPAAKLLAGFITADSLARAARIPIALPPAALERFAGEYTLRPNVVAAVTLDGDELLLRIADQAANRLLPMTPTTFFIKDQLGPTFEFETDPSGKVAAVTVVQGGARQRAVKTR